MMPCSKYIVPEVERVFGSIANNLSPDEIRRLIDVLYDPRQSNDLCEMLVNEVGYEPRWEHE